MWLIQGWPLFKGGVYSRVTLSDKYCRSCKGYPPRLKSFKVRQGSFSGKEGEEGFDLWLLDNKEATADFEWCDVICGRWLSWFIESLAKAN